jgi:hypothetical protein
MLAVILAVLACDPVRLQGKWVMVEQTIPDGTVLSYPKGPQPI